MSKMNFKKRGKLFAVEVFLVLALWAASVVLSSPVFDRPLDTHSEPITAHTLISLRALEERGFWNLLGVSVFTPDTLEYKDVDITAFDRAGGTYLSYPSLWLDLPYLSYKILNLAPFGVTLSPRYLQIYNLVVNRLLGGLIVYFLFLEIVGILAGNRLDEFQMRLLAFFGLIGWLFNPPVMYLTQNVYFSDQAVLLPVNALFLIALKCRFKPETLSGGGKGALAVAVFLACGIDWYGWIAAAAVMFLVLADKAAGRAGRSLRDFFAEYLHSVKYIGGAAALAGLTFLAQLFYFREGFDQVYKNFFYRTGKLILNADGQIVEITYFNLVTIIVLWWTDYYPRIVPYRQFYLGIAVVLLAASLYYFYKKNANGRLALCVYALLFVTPLAQIFLLKQHSFSHNFSALKMATPIVFSVFVLPFLFLMLLVQRRTTADGFFSKPLRVNLLLLAGAAILAAGFISVARKGTVEFALVGSDVNLEYGRLIAANVAAEDLPLAENPELSNYGDTFSGMKAWYGKRMVYRIADAKKMIETGKFNASVVREMTPIFFAFRDEPVTADINSICKGKWQVLAEKLNGREVVACKSQELQRLF